MLCYVGWDKRQTHFPVKATTRGLGTDLRYYEPTANATLRVVWRLEWNGICYVMLYHIYNMLIYYLFIYL